MVASSSSSSSSEDEESESLEEESDDDDEEEEEEEFTEGRWSGRRLFWRGWRCGGGPREGPAPLLNVSTCLCCFFRAG